MNSLGGGSGYDPRNLNIIFLALLSGQIIFLIMSMIMIEPATFVYDFEDLSFTLIPLAALAGDIISNRIFWNGFNRLTQEREMQQALTKLTAIHIVRWAIVEGGTLLLIVFSFLTSNHFFTAFAMANIAYFITLRPRLFTFNEGF
jgi:hypothetical protein